MRKELTRATKNLELEALIKSKLRECYDPEIPINLYDLGVFYRIELKDSPLGKKSIHIQMTLTSPGCPIAGSIIENVKTKLQEIPQISDIQISLIWDPPWSQSMMSESAKLQLGLV